MVLQVTSESHPGVTLQQARSVSGAEKSTYHNVLRKGNRKGRGTQLLWLLWGQSSWEVTGSANPTRPALLLAHFTEGEVEAVEGDVSCLTP